jgi:hypothetical protein
MGGACGSYGGGENCARHSEVKRPLRRPRRGRGDNIQMDLQEVGRGFSDWLKLAQDRDR